MAQNYNQLKSFTIKNYIYIHEYSPKNDNAMCEICVLTTNI